MSQPATLLKERLWQRCFFRELCEIILKFFTEHLWATDSESYVFSEKC